jgi:hypothetical protein
LVEQAALVMRSAVAWPSTELASVSKFAQWALPSQAREWAAPA